MLKRFITPVLLSTLFLFGENLNIGLDIGHDPRKGGCYSARGIKEYDYNRKTALSVYYALQNAGIEAFFVNADEKKISLDERVKAAQEYGATHFISIHHDSAKEQFLSKWTYRGKRRAYCDAFSGFSLFVSKKNPCFAQSRRLASLIGASLIQRGLHYTPHHAMDIKGERKELLDTQNGVYRYDNLVVLKRNRIPAVLLECGVIINRDEELLIDSAEYRKMIGKAIVRALKQSEL